MPHGYFKRIDPQPIKLRLDISKPVQIISQGDVIYADYDTYKDIVGFRFVGWTPPKQELPQISTRPEKPTKIYTGNDIDIVAVQATKQAPHKIFLENIKKEQEIKTSIQYVEDNQKEVPPELPVKNIAEDEMDETALLAYLKGFTQKNWFIMKKDVAIKYLEKLKVDFSNLPNNKSDLIKHLKKYVDSK